MFFEKYINFTNLCYFWSCGVIPVQSFGSPTAGDFKTDRSSIFREKEIPAL